MSRLTLTAEEKIKLAARHVIDARGSLQEVRGWTPADAEEHREKSIHEQIAASHLERRLDELAEAVREADPHLFPG